jgi:hypothetical protein
MTGVIEKKYQVEQIHPYQCFMKCEWMKLFNKKAEIVRLE